MRTPRAFPVGTWDGPCRAGQLAASREKAHFHSGMGAKMVGDDIMICPFLSPGVDIFLNVIRSDAVSLLD